MKRSFFETADYPGECYDRYQPQYQVKINGQIYPKSVLNIHNKAIDFACLKKSNKTKKIIIWNTFFDIQFDNSTCPLTNCQFTRNLTGIEEADLVLVHAREKEYSAFPEYTRPHYQRWVFSLYESPLNSFDVSRFNGYFNLSSTYLHDTDYPGLYQHQYSSRTLKKTLCRFICIRN